MHTNGGFAAGLIASMLVFSACGGNTDSSSDIPARVVAVSSTAHGSMLGGGTSVETALADLPAYADLGVEARIVKIFQTVNTQSGELPDIDMNNAENVLDRVFPQLYLQLEVTEVLGQRAQSRLKGVRSGSIVNVALTGGEIQVTADPDLAALIRGDVEDDELSPRTTNVFYLSVAPSAVLEVGQSALFFLAESVFTYADGRTSPAVGIVGDGMGAFIIEPNGVASRADTHFASNYAVADVRDAAADVSNQTGVARPFDP